MQQLASRRHHLVWVRALLLSVTTTLVLVVGSGAAYAQITVNTDDLAGEVAAPVQEGAEEELPRSRKRPRKLSPRSRKRPRKLSPRSRKRPRKLSPQFRKRPRRLPQPLWETRSRT